VDINGKGKTERRELIGGRKPLAQLNEPERLLAWVRLPAIVHAGGQRHRASIDAIQALTPRGAGRRLGAASVNAFLLEPPGFGRLRRGRRDER